MVVGGRYELYSNYALEIQAVAASTPTTGDLHCDGPDGPLGSGLLQYAAP
jgi:hypothetical protein